jgi:predicted CopG family antitoxin
MARKTISIDAGAYRRLRWAPREDESLSDTIERVVRPLRPISDWLERIGQTEFSDELVNAVNEQAASRSVPSRRFRAVAAKPARKERAKRAGKGH